MNKEAPAVDSAIKPKEPSKDTISIPASEWEAVKNRLDILTRAADQRRLSMEMTQDVQPGTKCKIAIYIDRQGNKLPVVSWRTTKDIVISDSKGIKKEEQEIKVKTPDDKEFALTFPEFGELRREMVDIVGTKSDKTGSFLTISYNGEEYEITPTFINP